MEFLRSQSTVYMDDVVVTAPVSRLREWGIPNQTSPMKRLQLISADRMPCTTSQADLGFSASGADRLLGAMQQGVENRRASEVGP